MVDLLSVIFSFVSGILQFLNSALPDSPFQGLIQETDAVTLGLGWLNWLLPVGDMMAIFAAYLVVLLAYFAVTEVKDGLFDLKGALIGESA